MNTCEKCGSTSAIECKVAIDYTNWRGERGTRIIGPGRLYYGTCLPWHPEPQWLLEAFDYGRGATRVFAMQNVHSWNPASLADTEKVS